MNEEIKVEKTEEEMLKELNESIEELMPAINGSAQIIDESIEKYLAGIKTKDYPTPVWVKIVNIVGCMFIARKLSGIARMSVKKTVDEDGFAKILGRLMEQVIVTFDEEFRKVSFDVGEESYDVSVSDESAEEKLN